MKRYCVMVMAVTGAALVSAPALAQGGRMGGGGMTGMRHDSTAMAQMMRMGMRHDSATMAQMSAIHELVLAHDRIKRTVSNLPDGVRTVTESDDPRLARLIKTHTLEMIARVAAGNDPGLPMESPALRTIFRNKDRIRTSTDTTATGIVVEQTSGDSSTVAALQQHATEVNDLVRDGMAAMHRAMMGKMMGALRDTAGKR